MKTAYKGRPVYTPKQKIESGLFTKGKEWMTLEGFKEWIGPYHKYPNGAVFTEGGFGDSSIQLIPYASAAVVATKRVDDLTGQTSSFNNGIYFRLTETRFNNYTQPKYHYPLPTKKDYEVAQIARYFVQKLNNEDDITEIDGDGFNSYNLANKPGLDAGQYRRIIVNWSISGKLKDVRIVNRKLVIEKNKVFPGLVNYLTDLDEFHKDRHIIREDADDNLHTSGGEYVTSTGKDYVGFYHTHPIYGPMEGPEHSEAPHQRLVKKTP